MLIDFPLGSGRSVFLTDEPETARMLQMQKNAVIGITGSEPDYSLWSGVFYLAESPEGVDETYARLAWFRANDLPQVIAEVADGCLRELKDADLDALMALYQEAECRRFLTPLVRTADGHLSDRKEDWSAWLDSYRRLVYESGEPGLWCLADAHDDLMGIAGLTGELAGTRYEYRLGYALRPEYRKKGLAFAMCCAVLKEAEVRELEPVTVQIREENQASMRLAERLKNQYPFLQIEICCQKD